MLYVEYYDELENKVCLSYMKWWKALIVHMLGYSKITFNIK